MKRFWPVLLTLLMIAPQATGWIMPVQDECQEVSECEQGGECDFDCSQCVCCAHRTPVMTPAAVSAPPEVLPASSAITASLAPVAPPPTDILHVPKSL